MMQRSGRRSCCRSRMHKRIGRDSLRIGIESTASVRSRDSSGWLSPSLFLSFFLRTTDYSPRRRDPADKPMVIRRCSRVNVTRGNNKVDARRGARGGDTAGYNFRDDWNFRIEFAEPPRSSMTAKRISFLLFFIARPGDWTVTRARVGD